VSLGFTSSAEYSMPPIWRPQSVVELCHRSRISEHSCLPRRTDAECSGRPFSTYGRRSQSDSASQQAEWPNCTSEDLAFEIRRSSDIERFPLQGQSVSDAGCLDADGLGYRPKMWREKPSGTTDVFGECVGQTVTHDSHEFYSREGSLFAPGRTSSDYVREAARFNHFQMTSSS